MITKDDLKCVLFPKFDYSDVVNIDYNINTGITSITHVMCDNEGFTHYQYYMNVDDIESEHFSLKGIHMYVPKQGSVDKDYYNMNDVDYAYMQFENGELEVCNTLDDIIRWMLEAINSYVNMAQDALVFNQVTSSVREDIIRYSKDHKEYLYDIYGHRPVGDGDVMTYDKNDGEYYGREDR